VVEWSIKWYHISVARKWTVEEEQRKKKELIQLYVRENRPIGEIGRILNLAETSVYDRLVRLNIKSLRSLKPNYNNQRNDIVIPQKYSIELAEFIGLMLGDGNLTPTQVTVTLGKKDKYAKHVAELICRLFGPKPKTIFSKHGDCIVYLGSTKIVRWLIKMGLAFNKVENQVDIPKWIFLKKNFMRASLRGLFDTDGSVYKLRWGMQISFCNRSRPLSKSVRSMLSKLGFHPSRISGYNLYLTRKDDIVKFLKEIGFKNRKHTERIVKFRSSGCVA